MLDSADDSPVQGLKLASISDDTSYLLYAGRWFPVNGYGINRFTATINITVPAHMVVDRQRQADRRRHRALEERRAQARCPARLTPSCGTSRVFPGTIIAGRFRSTKSDEAGIDLHVFFKPLHQNLGADYAEYRGQRIYLLHHAVWLRSFALP